MKHADQVVDGRVVGALLVAVVEPVELGDDEPDRQGGAGTAGISEARARGGCARRPERPVQGRRRRRNARDERRRRRRHRGRGRDQPSARAAAALTTAPVRAPRRPLGAASTQLDRSCRRVDGTLAEAVACETVGTARRASRPDQTGTVPPSGQAPSPSRSRGGVRLRDACEARLYARSHERSHAASRRVPFLDLGAVARAARGGDPRRTSPS